MRKIIIIAFFSVFLVNCTKLDEKFEGDLQNQTSSSGAINTDALLKAVYNSIQGTFQNQDGVYALWEMTTDELIGPTRGPDWDDNGVWRVLHEHKWDGENVRIRDAFKALNGVSFAATDMLRFNPTTQQAAEARFLRAMAMYMLLDGWDQVSYRDPGESVITPSRIRKGTEALTYIISEINAIMANLPDGPASKANKDAAKVLLMKCYLNKGVYANRQAPTFDNADMQQVITLADQIINSNKYSFSTSYFDNFAPSNDVIGKENIWTQENVGGTQSGGIRSRWRSTMHYNQNPQGWNGFSTLSDFYNKFEASDKRRGVAYPTPGVPNPGNRVNVGFLSGQQYDWTVDTMLRDRTGALLVFSPNVKSIETGTDLERTGIRAYKYVIDYANEGSGNVDNDYVYFRYGDVLLMKAEALLRTNNAGLALPIVNSIRTNRGATALGALTLDNLIDERGRELYLESWRRQDLIRFGKFLSAFQEKGESDPKYLLFAIPNQQLAINPNLKPNPGY
jgi:starch-binding outer membrane protein, SusD/RagB family